MAENLLCRYPHVHRACESVLGLLCKLCKLPSSLEIWRNSDRVASWQPSAYLLIPQYYMAGMQNYMRIAWTVHCLRFNRQTCSVPKRSDVHSRFMMRWKESCSTAVSSEKTNRQKDAFSLITHFPAFLCILCLHLSSMQQFGSCRNHLASCTLLTYGHTLCALDTSPRGPARLTSMPLWHGWVMQGGARLIIYHR